MGVWATVYHRHCHHYHHHIVTITVILIIIITTITVVIIIMIVSVKMLLSLLCGTYLLRIQCQGRQAASTGAWGCQLLTAARSALTEDRMRTAGQVRLCHGERAELSGYNESEGMSWMDVRWGHVRSGHVISAPEAISAMQSPDL